MEDLPQASAVLDPVDRILELEYDSSSVLVTPRDLRAIYFRQPVYLRDSLLGQASANETLARTQWAAFARNLMLFSECTWVNHPASTYLAEHKAYQLHKANALGFDVPTTRVANNSDWLGTDATIDALVAVKGLDTVLLRDGADERFGYTQLFDRPALLAESLSAAPAIFQQALTHKLDLRVTVVGSALWCAAISDGGRGVDGDWRLLKHDLDYLAFDLPPAIRDLCIALVRNLGLVFGAIDLALVDGRYYFLEINPTGEWLWLESAAGFPIAEAIARALTHGQGDPRA